MINVNLVTSRRKRAKRINYYYLGLYSVFAVIVGYFLYNVIYVVYFLFTTRSQLEKLNTESVAVSAEITKDSEKVKNYVISKFILLEIERLYKSKFAYKKYLDQIVSMLPTGNELKAIDFAKKEEVQFRVESANLSAFKELEAKMRLSNFQNTDFSFLNSTSVSRTAEGVYLTNFIIGINPKK